MNLFELINDRYVLPPKPRLFESFAGIGCQRMAFDRLEIDYESVGISEIDKYAVMSYASIHCGLGREIGKLQKEIKREILEKAKENGAKKKPKRLKKKVSELSDKEKYAIANRLSKNYGDITKIHGYQLPTIDVFTYSFPCTDLSKAGKQKGLNATRSGLVYEVLRILQELKDLNNLPNVLIMENVVDLVQTKFIREFNEIQLELESLGYSNYVETMNAKDYGVAQNRDRVFMVSILGDYYYEFPKKIKLEKRLKDYLEEKVDEKYYLSDKAIQGLNRADEKDHTPTWLDKDESAPTIDTRVGALTHWSPYIVEPIECVRLGGLYDDEKGNHQAGSIWDTNGLSPTIDTMQGGNRQPFVTVRESTEQGYAEAYEGDSINLAQPNSKLAEPVICASRGKNPSNPKSRESGLETVQMIEVNDSGLCNTLTTVQKDNMVFEPSGLYLGVSDEFQGGPLDGLSRCLKANMHDSGVTDGLRIRKLTPLECWRLMSIDDECFKKASEVNSNSQLYKQAGNGIVVDVFAAIIKNLKGTYEIHNR